MENKAGPLYIRYRPQSLDEIVGNQNIVDSLKAMLQKPKDKIPHAFLFVGESGCGKTTLGRILAKELGCVGQDYVELDSAAFRGIDTIRDVRRQSQYKSIESSCRVWLLDEIHALGAVASPALLKALEDPPDHVYYILATTDPQKLLPTIKGRCSQFQVSPLTDSEMYKLLRNIVRKEEETLEKEIYDQIIQDSLGHPRNALQILDQVLAVDADKRLDVAKHAADLQSQVIELCRALMKKAKWSAVAAILKGLTDQDEEQIRRSVLGYCNNVLLNGENDQAALILDEFMEPFYASGRPQLTWSCYKVVKS